jgi:hypothetical protein
VPVSGIRAQPIDREWVDTLVADAYGVRLVDEPGHLVPQRLLAGMIADPVLIFADGVSPDGSGATLPFEIPHAIQRGPHIYGLGGPVRTVGGGSGNASGITLPPGTGSVGLPVNVLMKLEYSVLFTDASLKEAIRNVPSSTR